MHDEPVGVGEVEVGLVLFLDATESALDARACPVERMGRGWRQSRPEFAGVPGHPRGVHIVGVEQNAFAEVGDVDAPSVLEAGARA